MIVSRGNGRYDVMSESGRRLGKNLSKGKAEKRLAMVEWFKSRDAKRRLNRKA
jgi:hypothetical protein